MSNSTDLLGITIPSTDPIFLGIAGAHILIGLLCVGAGAVAMLSPKRPGRHPTFGTIYFWGLGALFVSATMLLILRWREDYHLFVLGALAFGAALFGRTARRQRWHHWVPLHLSGMGASYIVMLTAFYVDNGKNLPLWRDLPIALVNLLTSMCCAAFFSRRTAAWHGRRGAFPVVSALALLR